MKRLWNVRVSLLFAGVVAAGACAQVDPEILSDKIPAGVPPELRLDIEMLHSSKVSQRADAIMKLRYFGMSGGAEPAIPFLIPILGIDAEFPIMNLSVSSLWPITESCSDKATFGGEAAETLARIGKTSDDLLGLLKSPQWQVRANAARALGGIKDARAVAPLIAFLANANEHPVVRGNAALALGLLGAADAVEPLIPLLRDNDKRVRAAAASALGKLRDPRALQSLIVAVGDSDARVRQSVVGGLCNLDAADVLEPIRRALKDPDRQVREVAAHALGRLKDARAVEPLIDALKDDYVNVQINAARALGEIKDPRAVPVLIPMLRNAEESLRSAAAEGLGGINDPRAVQPLIDMALKEKRETPLLRALQALEKSGHAGAKKAMHEYGFHRPNWNQWWDQNKAELLNGRLS